MAPKAEAPPAPKADAGVVVKPLAPADGPTYTVRQGDTLFSIAKTHNVPLRDLAAWNNIDDRYSISVGQQLRLTPPDGVAVTPVKPPGTVETRPLGGAPDGAPAAADPNVKTQPLGQRVPYSEHAYAKMSKAPLPAKPDARAEVKPEGKAEVKADPKAEPKAEPPRAAGNSAWMWPTQGKVIRGFNEGTNKGIAIAGARGQAVHAAAAGRVIFSGTGLRGLGRLIVIRHGNGYLSVYAHNDKLLVKEGQNVMQGQRIADMGSSDSDQVKLHFEIRRQGKPVDPLKLLPEG